MKKILLFGMTPNYCGIESFIINYYRNFDHNKLKFDFLTYNEEPAYSDEIKKNNDNIIIIPGRKNNYYKNQRYIKKIIRNNNYDIVWSNLCYLSDVSLLKFAYECGVPKRIIHSHNSENMAGIIQGAIHFLNKKRIENWATDFWACSEEAGKYFYSSKIINSEKFKIINNAINIKNFKFNINIREKIRKDLSINDKFVVGHVGRFHFQKNHKFLIDIFFEIQKRNSKSVLLLVGEGELEKEIRKKVFEYNISDKVFFLGVRHDVNELMQAMDCFILPSVFEGLAFVGIEAQVAGLQLIISNTISKEINITDLVHILSLKKDAVEWAEFILSLKNFEHKNELHKIVKAGFDIDTEAKKIEKILLE